MRPRGAVKCQMTSNETPIAVSAINPSHTHKNLPVSIGNLI